MSWFVELLHDISKSLLRDTLGSAFTYKGPGKKPENRYGAPLIRREVGVPACAAKRGVRTQGQASWTVSRPRQEDITEGRAHKKGAWSPLGVLDHRGLPPQLSASELTNDTHSNSKIYNSINAAQKTSAAFSNAIAPWRRHSHSAASL